MDNHTSVLHQMDAMTPLTGLTPFTSYSIQVAAVNEEGNVGLYSEPVTRRTLEGRKSLTKNIESLIESSSLSPSSSWSSDHHAISLFLQNKDHLE